MPRLLKQIGSDEIYVWTDTLSKRPDMEEYVRPDLVAAPIPPTAVDEPSVTELVAESETDIQEMAKAVLLKKPGRKA
jgi:hypothetical protein